MKPNYVVEIGRQPLKIQVLTGIDGVTFDQCFRRKILVNENGLKIPFIGLDELLKNKKAAGSHRHEPRYIGKIILGLNVGEALGHKHDLFAVVANQEQGRRKIACAPHAILGVVTCIS